MAEPAPDPDDPAAPADPQEDLAEKDLQKKAQQVIAWKVIQKQAQAKAKVAESVSTKIDVTKSEIAAKKARTADLVLRLAKAREELEKSGAFQVESSDEDWEEDPSMKKQKQKARQKQKRREEALEAKFLQGFDKAVLDKQDDERNQDKAIHLVTVYMCPNNESHTDPKDSLRYRLSVSTTFDQLREDTAKYWDVHPDELIIQDDRGAVWPIEVEVVKELKKYTGVQIIKLVLKEEEEAEEVKEESEMDEEEQLARMMAALSGKKIDEDEEEQVAQGEEDDDDDLDALPHYEPPPLNKIKLFGELLIHLTFAAALMWSVHMKRDIREAYQVFDSLNTVLVEEEFGDFNEKSFEDIRTFGEIWEWVEGPFSGALFESDVDDKGHIMLYNRLVGGLRFRQNRVTNDSCSVADSVSVLKKKAGKVVKETFVPACFADYTSSSRSKIPFGPKNISGFFYNTSRENGLPYHTTTGLISTYDGSGFVRDIQPREGQYKLTNDDFTVAIENLKANLWLDQMTRALQVSLTVYNGNFNLYCACNFLFEFSAGGVVYPTASFKVLRLDLWEFKNVKTWDDLRSMLLADIIVYAFVLKLSIGEISKCVFIKYKYKTTIHYFKNVWSILEIINLLPFYGSLAVRLAYVVDNTRRFFNVFDDQYQELNFVAQLYSYGFMMDAVSILMCTFKFFKYFQLNDGANMLWETLSRASKDIFFFLVMFGMLFIGFIVWANQLFGTEMLEFSKPGFCGMQLFLVLLGVVDMFPAMYEVNPTQALAFFGLFIVFMFFILINVFLAILNDAYSRTKEQMEEEQENKVPMNYKLLIKVWWRGKMAARQEAKEKKAEDRAKKKHAKMVAKAARKEEKKKAKAEAKAAKEAEKAKAKAEKEGS